VIEGRDVAHAAAYNHDIRIKNVDDARNGAGKTVIIAVKGRKAGASPRWAWATMSWVERESPVTRL
jgi:hypothetical protein